jgi:hypothetical protein
MKEQVDESHRILFLNEFLHRFRGLYFAWHDPRDWVSGRILLLHNLKRTCPINASK